MFASAVAAAATGAPPAAIATPARVGFGGVILSDGGGVRPSGIPLGQQPPPPAGAPGGGPQSGTAALLSRAQAVLEDAFGFQYFKGGQQDVILAALSGRDTAIYWATGAGKSLCYQLPAVMTRKTVVVVSPLISLMQDQVNKFNAMIGAASGAKLRACFLGSAQFDPMVEKEAASGMYQLVYVTPEKLMSFLEHAAPLKKLGGIALVAVDEAHCISQWGHDFRPSYRQLDVRAALPGVPIMALTATAVPRVQQDVADQLKLRPDTLKSLGSFDRPNLRIGCTRKTTRAADILRIVDVVRGIPKERGATIIYVTAKRDADSIAETLQERLADAKMQARAYHADLGPEERSRVHLGFLSGSVQAVVATTAFGMGIDKPDVRCVVHYGPPKTFEEYYQQIGRAGRDGLGSQCLMFANDSDFQSYQQPFYTQELTETGKQTMLQSLDALRKYAGQSKCRRCAILEYLNERPSFGKHCGNCDVCVAAAATPAGQSGNLAAGRRDFRPAVAPILEALAATASYPMAITNLSSVIEGKWKPKGWSVDGPILAAQPLIQSLWEKVAKIMRKDTYYREMLAALCDAGFVRRKRIQTNSDNRFMQSFEVYELTEAGERARSCGEEIILPVPMVIRKMEEEAEQKRREREAELQKHGIKLAGVPQEELDSEGPLLWYVRRVQKWKDEGKEDLARRQEELREGILEWRNEAAGRLRISPTDVLPEHTVIKIAYVKPTTVEGLRGVGVRNVLVEDLAMLLQRLTRELFPPLESELAQADDPASAGGGEKRGAPMLFPAGAWQPPGKWDGAVAPKKRPANWELTYDRFCAGEALEAIALQQGKGKPVLVTTIAGHLLTALEHGRPVDLGRFAQQLGEGGVPSQAEWARIEEAAAERRLDPAIVGDFRAKDVLCGILGDAAVGREPTEKSEVDKKLEEKWYKQIRLWISLRRVRFPATFGFAEGGDAAAAAKRLRSA